MSVYISDNDALGSLSDIVSLNADTNSSISTESKNSLSSFYGKTIPKDTGKYRLAFMKLDGTSPSFVASSESTLDRFIFNL